MGSAEHPIFQGEEIVQSQIKILRKQGCKRGAVDNALVDINKVLQLRTLTKPELKSDGKSEYYVSMDVARSENSSNNQSSIAVLKVRRNKDNRVVNIKLVNIINLPHGLNFTAQAIEFKRVKNLYKARIAICDINGIGKGLSDMLMKEQIDPLTGESLGCWDTINTDEKPDDEDAEKCLFGVQSQGINTDIIVNFIDMVEGGKLQLLVKHQDNNYDINDHEFIKNNVLPHVQTDLLIEEVSNLKLKHLSGGKLGIERIVRRVDKDRFSAVSYGLWYIMTHEDKPKKKTIPFNTDKMFLFKKANIRKY